MTSLIVAIDAETIRVELFGNVVITVQVFTKTMGDDDDGFWIVHLVFAKTQKGPIKGCMHKLFKHDCASFCCHYLITIRYSHFTLDNYE